MPLYEYVCQKCGVTTERIQSHASRPLRLCPECGGKVRKAISVPAIQFKGSGFYITDYGKGDMTSKTKSEAAGAEKSEKAEKAEKAEKTEKAEKSSGKSESTGSGEGASQAAKAEKKGDSGSKSEPRKKAVKKSD
jgi:putative FmdB family regulatory protein